MLLTTSSVPRTSRYKNTTTQQNQIDQNFQEVLDKKFGPSWHVIVGEGFGFEISYETKKMFYMFSAGKGSKHINICQY